MPQPSGKIGDIIEDMVSDKVDAVLAGEWFAEMVNQRIQLILNAKDKKGRYEHQVEDQTMGNHRNLPIDEEERLGLTPKRLTQFDDGTYVHSWETNDLPTYRGKSKQ